MATFVESQDAALHDDFDAARYRTWAKRFLNEAVGLIYRNTTLARGDVTLTATIGPGDAIEDLASEGIVILGISRQDNGDTVDYLPRAEFEQLKNELGSSNTGPPAYYTVTGTGTATVNTMRVEFLPVADQSYTLDIVARFSPAQMTADGDTVPLPPDYQWFPVRYARKMLFALEDDDQMERFWNNLWGEAIVAIRVDMQRRIVGVRQTPSMWAGIDRGPRFHSPHGQF